MAINDPGPDYEVDLVAHVPPGRDWALYLLGAATGIFLLVGLFLAWPPLGWIGAGLLFAAAFLVALFDD